MTLGGGQRGGGAATPPVSCADPTKPSTPRHVAMSWGRRLKRVFGVEIECCARCGWTRVEIHICYRRGAREIADREHAGCRDLLVRFRNTQVRPTSEILMLDPSAITGVSAIRLRSNHEAGSSVIQDRRPVKPSHHPS